MFFPLYDENPVRRTPVLTYLLVALNVLAFLWTLRLTPLQEQELAYRRGFVPARLSQLKTQLPIQVEVTEGAIPTPFGLIPQKKVLTFPPDREQIVLSLVTCMFLHGSWLHLLGNMWFLYLFGNNVEDRLGPARFLLLYLLGGLLASFSHWLVDRQSLTPVIGASGAVAAVLGAYTVTWPWARVHTLVFLFIFITVIEVPALVVNGVWFIGQVLAGQQAVSGGGGVAWWAHVGGFIAGAALMQLLDFSPRAPEDSDGGIESKEDNERIEGRGLRGEGTNL
jgi:membrane associated rhomboid family serine protease